MIKLDRLKFYAPTFIIMTSQFKCIIIAFTNHASISQHILFDFMIRIFGYAMLLLRYVHQFLCWNEQDWFCSLNTIFGGILAFRF